MTQLSPPLPRGRVRVHGPLDVAQAICRFGASAGLDISVAPAPVDAPTRYGRYAPALLNHDSAADVDVVLAWGAVPPAAHALMLRDQAHLLVVATEDDVMVGPVVVPGVSACGTCLGLHRADSDPAWPHTALRLHAQASAFDRGLLADPVVCGHVSAVVAREAMAHLSGLSTNTTRVDAEGARRVPTPAPHPQCRCGAQAA